MLSSQEEMLIHKCRSEVFKKKKKRQTTGKEPHKNNPKSDSWQPIGSRILHGVDEAEAMYGIWLTGWCFEQLLKWVYSV